MTRSSRRSLLALALLVLPLLFGAAAPGAGLTGRLPGQAAAPYPRTIVLVRHAEKQATEGGDPSLSEAGSARAKELARHLGHAGVTRLFATEFKRTQETLAPLATATGAPLTIVSARDEQALLAELAALPAGSVAVVAGHSNTIPKLATTLVGDGRPAVEIGEQDYDRLLVVTQWSPAGASLLELRY